MSVLISTDDITQMTFTDPRKGDAVNSIIGADSSCGRNKSPIVPPDTERKADPENPSKNRDTSIVSIF